MNEGQANSVTSAMIVNGVVSASDLQDGATLAEILDDDGSGSGLDAMGSAEKVDSFAIVNKVTPLRVDLSLVPWATMWHFPLETIPMSEAGYERNYQGTSTLVWWDLALPPEGRWEMSLLMAVGVP